jgi:formylglycine-generating enzyme required for sulfatase activity
MSTLSKVFAIALLLSPTLLYGQGSDRSFTTVPAGQNSKRIALVVGNATYQHATMLKNPLNDASAMEKTLQALGFEVIRLTNTSRSTLKKAVNDWGERMRGYDVALFYYAGHAIEVEGINYLCPVEANPLNKSQVEDETVTIRLVTGWMEEARTKTNIVLLDACRDNPFRSFRSGGPEGGLASMSAPSGTFVGFAATPGMKAADGTGVNGLYTEAVLKTITLPNLTIDQIFNQVNAYVRQKSGGAQVPFKNSSLEADFYFIKNGGGSDPGPIRPREEPRKAEPTPVVPAKPTSNKFMDLPFAEMAYVPGGTFDMGSRDGETDEKPVHEVTVSGFWMGKYEITQRQWVEIMGTNPSYFKDCEDCPVEKVSWDDVQEFLRELNNKTGGKYRLPTEAEWEYAAGGGSENPTKYGNGNESLRSSDANYSGTLGKTAKVGSYRPNALGLHDMSGNVYEWCSDWFRDYTSSRQTNPTGAASGSSRVLRGGSWNYYPQFSRVANRNTGTPSNRRGDVGFRVVAPQ